MLEMHTVNFWYVFYVLAKHLSRIITEETSETQEDVLDLRLTCTHTRIRRYMRCTKIMQL